MPDPTVIEIIGSGLFVLGLPGYYLTCWLIRKFVGA